MAIWIFAQSTTKMHARLMSPESLHYGVDTHEV